MGHAEAALESESKTYINQWLKTATDGNVVYERAFATDRAMFFCKKCNQTLILPGTGVEGTKVDYALQEFVKIHSHLGGHATGVTECLGCGTLIPKADRNRWCGGCYKKPDPTPVTADFKKVGVKSVINPFQPTSRRFK